MGVSIVDALRARLHDHLIQNVFFIGKNSISHQMNITLDTNL